MHFETSRLIIRNILPEDAADMYAIRHSQFVMQYNCMKPVSLEEFRAMLERNQNKDGWLHIILKESGKPIGMIGAGEDDLRYQVKAMMIDYYLGEQYARKGYMSEALYALMKHLFENENVELISARVFGENTASEALLKKLGFIREGTLRKGVRTHDGVAHEDKLFSILREEFLGMKKG